MQVIKKEKKRKKNENIKIILPCIFEQKFWLEFEEKNTDFSCHF